MQPRSEGPQTLRSFQIATNPRAQLYAYTDHLGNAVYHFNLLREHEELRIEAQAVVEIGAIPATPEKLDDLEWGRYNNYNMTDDHFDMLGPSKFARRPSPELGPPSMKHRRPGKAGGRSAQRPLHRLGLYARHLRFLRI